MIVRPSFYDNFRCIASECPDTCCAGWEIEVDSDTEGFYSALSGEARDFVHDRLTYSEEGGALLCREGERCAFLREDNLCELILKLGQGALCDICREHPRFYSQTQNITEVGVGLCCPEAARLWLLEPLEFVCEDDGYPAGQNELSLYERQMQIIERILKNDRPLGKRLCGIIADSGEADGGEDGALYEKLCELYGKLELLDPDFSNRFSKETPTVSDERFAKLAAYFVYRYFFELGERLCVRFSVASVIMIAAMGEDVALCAKDYSKEVEYDTDNLDKIYGFLNGCCGLGELCEKIFL